MSDRIAPDQGEAGPDTVNRGARQVFLIGFMAAGKSTIGELVAERLDRPFIDLDSEIERAAGQSIPAIFDQEGEAGFRRREADALRAVIDGPAAVIATGGGAPCHGDNLHRMRESGVVIALTAPLDVLRARVSDPSTRPLLMAPEEDIRALYESRISRYRQAHASVRTEDQGIDAIARQVVRLHVVAEAIPRDSLGNSAIVALSERAYPIIVTSGALERLGELVRSALGDPCTRVGVISDDNVAPLYGERTRAALAGAGFDVVEQVIPAGEPSKCFAEYARLVQAMAAGGLDRRSAIIALGGGVVGDLAGLVAATLYRGIPVVQVPTTVLSMVDSAIGGKTGINIEAGKNLVGAFWQPRLVLADTDVLATLPGRERRAAFGELVKYGLLDSEDLYQAVASLTTNTEGIPEVIRRCAAVKSWIVARDEREQTGERALLNLGHTVGHAIEAAAGYGELLHGEAVGLGLVASCRVSARLGLCDPALETRVVGTLRAAGLDADVDPWLRPEVLDRIGVDKKRTGKGIRFVTVQSVGACSTTQLTLSELSRILRD